MWFFFLLSTNLIESQEKWHNFKFIIHIRILVSDFDAIHVNTWLSPWGPTPSGDRRKQLHWTVFLHSQGGQGPRSVFNSWNQPVNRAWNTYFDNRLDKIIISLPSVNHKTAANPSRELEKRKRHRRCGKCQQASHFVVTVRSLFHRHDFEEKGIFLNCLRGKVLPVPNVTKMLRETQPDLVTPKGPGNMVESGGTERM